MFERVKVMIAMALIHLCFGGDSHLGYVKNDVLLIFFLPQLHYQAKWFNWTGLQPGRIFPNIFPNIWLWKSDPLNNLSSVFSTRSCTILQREALCKLTISAFHFRENFLQLDIYYPHLETLVVQQQAAYTIPSFFGKCFYNVLKFYHRCFCVAYM